MPPTTYWDVGNLLQITYGDIAYEIQCVGRAKSASNARCRWMIGQPSRTNIHGLLLELSAKKPGDVTVDKIRELADLCLCRDYHANQREEVVRRWTAVIERAAQHYDNARTAIAGPENMDQSARDMTPESEKVVSVTVDLVQTKAKLDEAEAELTKHRTTVSIMQKERENLHRETHTLKEQAGKMNCELKQLKDQLQTAEQDSKEERHAKSALEFRVNELKANAVETSTGLEKEKAAMHARLASANEKLESSQAELNDILKITEVLRSDIGKLQAENSSLTQQLGQLQTEAVAAKDESRRLGAELKVSDQALHETRTQLQDKQTVILTLDGQMERLQGRVLGLEKSISTCSMHRLRAWIRLLGRSPKSSNG